MPHRRPAVIAIAVLATLAGLLAAPRPAVATGPESLALVSLPAPATGAVTAALQAAGLEVTALQHVPVAVVKGTAAELTSAAAVPGVLRVELDRPLPPLLDETVAQIGADSVHDELGFDGTGITVAVVDSADELDVLDDDVAVGEIRVGAVDPEEHYLPGISLPVPGLASTDTTPAVTARTSPVSSPAAAPPARAGSVGSLPGRHWSVSAPASSPCSSRRTPGSRPKPCGRCCGAPPAPCPAARSMPVAPGRWTPEPRSTSSVSSTTSRSSFATSSRSGRRST